MEQIVLKSCHIFGCFYEGNEISKVEGIQGLQELRELVLDQNKIKVSVHQHTRVHSTTMHRKYQA